MQDKDLAREWSLLQNQFDSYEKFSLLIKLTSTLVLTTTLLVDSANFVAAAILVTLWMQDAIWKTFQSRIESRLLQLEQLLAQSVLPDDTAKSSPYQFNTLYLLNRRGGIHLIQEYLLQAIRPTVAFSHIVLLGLASYHLFA